MSNNGYFLKAIVFFLDIFSRIFSQGYCCQLNKALFQFRRVGLHDPCLPVGCCWDGKSFCPIT